MMEFIKIAEDAARVAGKKLIATQREFREIQLKTAIDDVVSSADIESDDIIVEALRRTPFNILSEESGFVDRKSLYTWIVDSLDGSSNYVSQIPYFGVSIGLAKEGIPIGGVIYDPIHEAMYSALENHGAYMNGGILSITSKEIAESILNSDFVRGPKTEAARLMAELAERSRYLRVCGSAVIGMMEVAAGHSQAYAHLGLKSWDGCAGAAIIREAGGIVTNKFGELWNVNDPSFIAASPKIHKEIMDVIRMKKF